MLRHSFINCLNHLAISNTTSHFLSFHPQKNLLKLQSGLVALHPRYGAIPGNSSSSYSYLCFQFDSISHISLLSQYFCSSSSFFVGYTLSVFKDSTLGDRFFKPCILKSPHWSLNTCTHTLLLPSTYLIVYEFRMLVWK